MLEIRAGNDHQQNKLATPWQLEILRRFGYVNRNSVRRAAAAKVCAVAKLCATAAPNTKPPSAVGAEREAVKLARQSITPGCSAASIALGTWSHRCLTPRSTGAPTAGHQARAGGTRYIFTVPGLASCRRRPVTSNVRRQSAIIPPGHHREQPEPSAAQDRSPAILSA